MVMKGHYEPNGLVKCPHCRVTVQLIATRTTPQAHVGRLNCQEADFYICFSKCTSCDGVIVAKHTRGEWELLVPRAGLRNALSDNVPDAIAADYNEAGLTLPVSTKASAALTRRALQATLKDQGTTKRDLFDQLDEMKPALPAYIQEFIDAVRIGGNMSVHPKISSSTMEIVDVEPGEAEWLLDLLDLLFDHYYDKPAQSAARMTALKAKYEDSE